MDANQFAYRQGRGTSDALKGYVQTLEEARNEGRQVVTVAFDLSNAFHSTWMPYISRQLKRAGVGCSFGKICFDFLKDRTVSSGRIE